MNMTGSKPIYSAVLIRPENGDDLGPVDVCDAQDDHKAIEIGNRGAPARLRELGLDRAILQISCDGRSLGRFEVRK
jgi:hypothetical protein